MRSPRYWEPHEFADLQTHLPPANDRMVTTLFVAALLHGIVILGVTFSSPDGDADSDRAPGLEVILVNDSAPSVKSNAKARYLAQRNQEGSGNTLSRERALIPKSSLAPAMRPGAANGDGVELHQAGHDAGR
jgi:periplasmic protein TonB